MRKVLPSQGIMAIISWMTIIVNMIFGGGVGAVEISEEMVGRISMNCGSIRVQLENLQKMDSRMRVYLGSKYELVLTNFMTNLNLRLVKNNLASVELTGLQTTFLSERERFKADFTRYSQELERLIEVDCRAEPERFYEQLEVVRMWRGDVRASCGRLVEVMRWHREAVVGLRDGLGGLK